MAVPLQPKIFPNDLEMKKEGLRMFVPASDCVTLGIWQNHSEAPVNEMPVDKTPVKIAGEDKMPAIFQTERTKCLSYK